jgi:hypothetical protein
MGSGLGALEPLFRDAKAEGDALKKRRDEALAAKLAAAKKSAGEKVRAYFTSERDRKCWTTCARRRFRCRPTGWNWKARNTTRRSG